jgi:endonuclease G
MMPQASENNRGIWAKAVERPTRQYVLRRARGDVFVYTGSVGEITRIGSGRVVVPANLFKLVYDQERGEAWAFWVDNTNTAKMSAPVTYSEIKRLTGIDFNLPIR